MYKIPEREEPGLNYHSETYCRMYFSKAKLNLESRSGMQETKKNQEVGKCG